MSAARLRWTYRAIAFGSRFLMSDVETVGHERARRELVASSRGPRWLVGTRPPLERVEDDVVDGVRVRRHRPEHARPGAVVFCHGGGFVVGDLDTHDVVAGTLAAWSEHEVVSVDYRRAPEHRYPAAFDDCCRVARALAAHGPVAIAGDSAGGNLAAAVAQHVPVAAQVLFYPVLDCAEERPSYVLYDSGYVLTAKAMRYFRQAYVPVEAQRREPTASPLRAATLSGLAPTFLAVAACDVLHDEGVEYADRLRAAGVDVTFEEAPGTLHAYVSFLGLAEAQGTLRRAAHWVRGQLAASGRTGESGRL